MEGSYEHGLDGLSLLDIIQAHPQGLKEYDLLQAIYEPLSEAETPNISDSLTLFQQHFWLFHTLYKLRDYLHLQGQGSLVIEPLNIQWLPEFQTSGAEELPGLHDPLRDYYLNLENLSGTGRDDVDKLLSSFWERLVDDADKIQALALFDLPVETDYPSIKRRYRQLLSDVHPDRGGCHEQTVALNDAMSVLKRCYSP
ncbi:DNA-J related domain-containing protein [Maricurvus nonylphenolicus]|uniref:DNA-J related domain-containing protein n=1 Tax=Maricurvus nonylphenolicus TaxID=1008307 RepID=UPI0036F25DFB